MEKIFIFLMTILIIQASTSVAQRQQSTTRQIPESTTSTSSSTIPSIGTKFGDVNMLNTVDETGNEVIWPSEDATAPKEVMTEAEGAYFRPLFVYRQQQAKWRNQNNNNNRRNFNGARHPQPQEYSTTQRNHQRVYQYDNNYNYQNYQPNTHWRRSVIYKRSPTVNYAPPRRPSSYRTKFNRFLPRYRFRS